MRSLQMQSQSPSYLELVSFKSHAREQQVSAVYEASSFNLEAAGQRMKQSLRGESVSIARPRRFAVLN
jgi:hypothetical protein